MKSMKLARHDPRECNPSLSYYLSRREISNIIQMLSNSNCGRDITYFDFSNCSENNNITHFLDVFRMCHNLESVYLAGNKPITVTTIMELCMKCTKLHTVHAHMQIPEEAISVLAFNCPSLTSLTLTLSNFNTSTLSDDCVLALAENCKQLKELNIKTCHMITDISMLALGDNCPSLEILRLDFCGNITDQGLISLAQGCRSLTSLGVCGANLSNASVLSLAENCHELMFVDLGSCGGLSNDSLIPLVEHCSKLISIRFCDVSTVTIEFIEIIAYGCYQLSEIKMYRCPLIQKEVARDIISNGICPSAVVIM